ncbi:hypothetical protein [Methanobrevibacter sp.]
MVHAFVPQHLLDFAEYIQNQEYFPNPKCIAVENYFFKPPFQAEGKI